MILTKIRYGTGAPNDTVGADGDLYLDTASGDLYQRLSGVYSLTLLGGGGGGSSVGADLYLFFNY